MKITRYMAEQPRAVAAAFAEARRRLAELGLSGSERPVLVGSGSSLNASLVAGHYLAGATVVPPVDFLSRPPEAGAGALVMILTQSGASTTSIEAARKAGEAGARVVIVTANPHSAAAALGFSVIDMPIGEEPIGPKTKGYAASCAALLALAAGRGAGIEAPDADALEAALADAWRRARVIAPELDALDYVLAAGAGAGHGTALEGSLKIAEIAGLPTAAFSMEETLHGRLHGTTSSSLVLPIVSDETTRAQADRIRAALSPHGVRVEPVPGLPEPWSMLAATFFFQALAVELALRRGREPDLMHYPGLTRHLDIKADDSL